MWEQGREEQVGMVLALRVLISIRNSLSNRIARKSLKTFIDILFYPKLSLGANLISTRPSYRTGILLAPASAQEKLTCAAS